MDKYRKLLKNSAVFFIANFGSKVLSFLLVRFYTDLLSTTEYGVLDIINTTVSLAVPIVTLCITEAVLRFSIDEIENRKKIFSLGIEIVILGNLLFVVSVPLFLSLEVFRTNVFMIYLLTLTNSLFVVSAHFSRGIGKSKIFAVSGFSHTLIQIGLNILFLAVFSWGIKGYLWASVLANVFSTIIVIVGGHLTVYIGASFDKKYLRGMLLYSIPLIPNTLFWWIMQSADRYVITFVLNSSDNGIYAAANKIPTIIITLSNIFTQAWQLSSVDEAKSKDKSRFYSNIFQTLSLVVICSASLILLILPYFYKVYVNASYYEGWTCVPYLLLAMSFSCFASFLGTNYVAMKKTKGVFLTTVIGATVNLLLNFLLTPVLGIKGTALATAVSFFITWIIRAIDTRKFVKINYDLRVVVLPLIIFTAQTVTISLGYYNLFIQAALFLCIILLFSNQIISLLNKLLGIVSNRRIKK